MKKHKYFIAVLLLFVNFLSMSNGYNFHGCAIAPNSNHGWVVTIESTLIYHTWNCGVNWEQQQISTSRDFFDVFFLDSLNGWTANRLAMIWYTSDGGLNWNWQSLGMSKFATRIFFYNLQYGWAAAGSGIVIRTNDSGATWQQVIIEYLPLDTVDFYGVSFVDTLKGWMAAGRYPEDSAGVPHFKKGQGFIVHSENGGDSWILQRRDTIYDFFDVKFKDELEGWVVGGNDSTMEACVLHTTNGGQNWTQQTIPASARYLRALELIDGNKLWAVGRNGTIIYSSNGGTSWVVQVSGVDTTLFDVDFSDSLRGLIAGNGVVLYTHDGGNTWVQANISGIEQRVTADHSTQTFIRAFPNPFSNNTSIRFRLSLESDSDVRIQKSGTPDFEFRIYNAAGKLIITILPQSAWGDFIWNGKDYQGKEVEPGVYFGCLKIANQNSNQKLILVKVK